MFGVLFLVFSRFRHLRMRAFRFLVQKKNEIVGHWRYQAVFMTHEFLGVLGQMAYPDKVFFIFCVCIFEEFFFAIV